jgi:endo-1,4-beta-xylanase
MRARPELLAADERAEAEQKKKMLTKILHVTARGAILISLLGGCGPSRYVPTYNPQANSTTPIQTKNTPSSSPPTELPTQAVVPTAEPSLRASALQHGLLIGSAVSYPALIQDPLYSQTLSREFSILTPENAMKFDAIHPSQKVYDFSEADAIVTFAKQHGMQVRGHTLVWDQALPKWLTARNFNRDEMIGILKDHILTVVGHYRGQVAAWDVVNEAVADNGSLRDSIWLRTIGPEYIEMAFAWAHEADPRAQLFYNDYGNQDLGGKSNAIYALMQGLIKRGVPINGVGFQMHLTLNGPPRSQDVVANMKRLGELGVDVHITEMDVRIPDASTAISLAPQAGVYREMLQACLSATNCNAFVLWGFTDRYSWIPHAFPGYGGGLIFDESYKPKPAYYALLAALK